MTHNSVQGSVCGFNSKHGHTVQTAIVHKENIATLTGWFPPTCVLCEVVALNALLFFCEPPTMVAGRFVVFRVPHVLHWSWN